MEFFAAVLLALALSADGFSVGLAYGIRKVTMSFLPVILITACSALAMAVSIFTGRLVGSFISYQLASMLGGVVLILIGFWQLMEGLKKYQDNPVLLRINLRLFGLVLQVMREPGSADMDKSGDINYKEALLLGVALNLDAVGAGFGVGIAGFSLFLVPIVTAALFLALLSGLLLGKKCAAKLFGKKSYILPGMILIIVGLVNIMI